MQRLKRAVAVIGAAKAIIRGAALVVLIVGVGHTSPSRA